MDPKLALWKESPQRSETVPVDAEQEDDVLVREMCVGPLYECVRINPERAGHARP